MNTKKLFSFLFILTLSMSLTHASGDGAESQDDFGDQGCGLPGEFDYEDLLEVVAPAKCLNKIGVTLKCKCIHKDMNPATQANIAKGYEDFLSLLNKKKKPYFDRFASVYEKVTVQAAAQKEVLGIQTGPEVVGCTPQDMSTGISKKMDASIPIQITELESIKETAEKDFKSCKNGNIFLLEKNYYGCDFFKNRADLMGKKIEKLKNSDGKCMSAINAYNTPEAREKFKRITTIAIQRSRMGSSLFDRTTLEIALAWNKFLNGETDIEELLKTKGVLTCASAINTFESVIKIYEDIESKGDEVIQLPKSLNANVQCQPGDSMCKAFAEKNKDLLKGTIGQYKAKPEDCVTYAEYATFKGMPSPELLKELANSKHPEKLLSDLEANSRTKHRVNFLKANPILAVVAKGSNNVELGAALKKMAQNILGSKDKSEAAKFSGYLDFMKNDFKKIYDKNHMSADMAVCDELQRNYAAIEISNDLPELPSEDNSGNKIDRTKKVVLQCIGKIYKDTNTTQLDKTLKLSPIYVLGDESLDKEPSEKGFEAFKADICGDYAKHRADNCKDISDQAKCRDSFHKTGEFSQIKEIMKDQKLNPEFDQKSINNIAAQSDQTKQYEPFKEFWHKEIGSKLSQQVIMGRNDNGEFAAAMSNNQSITNSPDIQSQFQSYQDNGGSSSSSLAESGGNSSNNTGVDPSSTLTDVQEQPGQQVPDYAKEVPTFDPSKLAGATGPKDLIPNFDKLPLEDQKQSLTDVKKFVASQEDSPFEAKDVDKDLDKVNSEIIKELAELKGNIAKVKAGDKNSVGQSNGQKSSGTKFSTNTNSANSSGGNQQSGNSSVSSGGSVNASGKIDGGNKTANAINTHLIKTFEERSGVAGNVEGRSPASKGDITINFQKGVLDPSLLQPGLVVSEVVPDSHEDFEKIKGNLDQLKKYLAEQIDPKQVKEPMVYKIKDPMANPDSYILFHVSQASNGAINVKTIDRKSTLKGLNNTLK